VQPIPVALDEAPEMRGADLLVAFEQEPDAQRERPNDLEVGLDRLQARQEVALVVCHAATKEEAVALGDSEWVGLPLRERIGWLHIEVVVHQQRPATLADLADDRRRPTRDAQRLRRPAEPLGRSDAPSGHL